MGVGFPPDALQLKVTSSPLLGSNKEGVDTSTDGGAAMDKLNDMVITYRLPLAHPNPQLLSQDICTLLEGTDYTVVKLFHCSGLADKLLQINSRVFLG